MANILLERFVRSFPKQFLSHLMERQQAIYELGIAQAYNSDLWTEAEARGAWPTFVRILWESELRKIAVACGLKAFDMLHAGENSSCVTVKADGMVLTGHRVNSPDELVREAVSRTQNSAVNKWLNEYPDERLLLNPLPTLGTRPIYLNLLHGAYFSKSDTGILAADPASCFLQIAVPEEGAKKYLYNWSAQQILLAYSEIPETSATLPHAIEDRAQPRKKVQQPKVHKISAGKDE